MMDSSSNVVGFYYIDISLKSKLYAVSYDDLLEQLVDDPRVLRHIFTSYNNMNLFDLSEYQCDLI